MSLADQFMLFAKFGKAQSDGCTINLSQIDKWLKQAEVIGCNVDTTDTAITFYKFQSKTLDFCCFGEFLEELAERTEEDVDEMMDKLSNCGAPSTCGTAQPVMCPVVERLTDPSKYTGTQRGRFNEDGTGKGLSDRDECDDPAYASGGKGQGKHDNDKKCCE